MNSEHKKDLVSGFANLQEVAITARPAPRSAAPNVRAWPRRVCVARRAGAGMCSKLT